MRVASNVWPGYEPFFLARSLGLYNQSAIRLVEMPSASQVSHAIRNGTVEAAALTLDETLTLIQNTDVDLRVALIIDISNGADTLLGRASLSNLTDLRGKQVGVENTATGAVLLDAALQVAQLKITDIKLVPITVNDHFTAWKNHEIDAIVTFEPVRSAILNTGAVELFNSSQIHGRIMDVLVVRADAINNHAAAIKQLISGFFRACDYLNQHPDDAATRIAPRLRTDPKQVIQQFQGLQLPNLAENRKWLSAPAPTLMNSASELATLMTAHRLLQGSIQVDHLADDNFLPTSPK